MQPTVTIDASGFNRVMLGLYDAMLGQGKDIANLLKDQHRLLTKTIVNFTPPLPARGAQQTGKDAVKRDLYALISEAAPPLLDRVGSKYGLHDIDAWRTSKTKGRQHLLWENIDPTGANLPALHNQFRNPRTGRPYPVPRPAENEWRSRIVVPIGTREGYVAQIQAHVGRWKARWAFAAAQLGAKFPSWISRHFGQPGGVFTANLDG